MGSFEISKDVEAIYFYDGLVKTTNDPDRDIYEDARTHYNCSNNSFIHVQERIQNKMVLKQGKSRLSTNADESFSLGIWESLKPIFHQIGPMMNSCM